MMVQKIRGVLILICVMFMWGCTYEKKQTCTFAPVESISSESNLDHSVRSNESGGNDTAILVQDNYAYLGVGKTLIILDVMDPSSPKQVVEILLPGNIDWIFLADNYIFLSDNNWPEMTSIVNVSNPYSPMLMECEEGISVPSVRTSLVRNHIFASLRNNGSLTVYEIINETEKTKLVETFSYHSLVPPSIRLLPRPQVKAAETRLITDVAVVGQYAYVAENLWDGEAYNKGQIKIFDVSDPTVFKVVADYNMPNNGSAVRLFADDNYIMIANVSQVGGYVAIILDITNPEEPQVISTVTGLEVPLTVHDNIAYFNRVEDGLATIRVRSQIDSGRVIQADWDTSAYSWVFGWSGDMTIIDDHAYFFDAGLLRIVDVANPFSPQEIITINVINGPDK